MKEKGLMGRTGRVHYPRYSMEDASRAGKRDTLGDTARKENQKEKEKA